MTNIITMNNKTSLIPFAYKGTPVSVIVDEKGNPWWLAREICQVLKFADNSRPLRSLDTDDKATVPIQHDSYKHDQVIINEGGLYKLLFKSRIPAAHDFQNWIAHDVLPSIRKTGSYGSTSALKEATRILSAMVDKLDHLEKRMDTYELKQGQVAVLLAPVKEVSLRLKISQLVRAFVARQTNGYSHQDAFDKLYYQFKYRYNIDLPLRANNAGSNSTLSYAESHGYITDLYNLTTTVFGGVL